ncbi:tetratricopeptide repeat protein [Chenggangzhangella methanolivorans]|uniref:Tetratricopeptide repeat protein n=1 Tax=Chenggangzhangella methanolivorans TaxID=1437009 RepID=A0A9E6R9Y6_9HYPH|nr:tetratricopeptide repeat protein [Chenggangzhangella methanolivorans]QZO00854.1 tetratricopeptide repeat protein [Chenggangzhangella methanolivorans]
MDPSMLEPIALAINLFGLFGFGKAREAGQLVDQGFVLVEDGRYEEAVEVLTRALALDPEDVDALERRATAYLMLEQRALAIADLQTAASLAPQAAEVRAGLCAAIAESDPAAAMPHCDIAIRLDPEDAPSLNNRSTALGLLGRDEEALADLDRAVALAPDEFIFRANRAITLVELGEFERAAEDVDYALAIQPNDPTMMLALARIVLSRGDVAEARALVGSVLNRGSDHAEALAVAGWVSLAEDAPSAAVEAFDLALARQSGGREGQLRDRVKWMALCGRSAARRSLGDVAGAEADLGSARDLKPSVDRVAAAWGRPLSSQP